MRLVGNGESNSDATDRKNRGKSPPSLLGKGLKLFPKDLSVYNERFCLQALADSSFFPGIYLNIWLEGTSGHS